MRKFDAVVIGAGIGGGSLVYNLLKQGFTGSILVVDQAETVAAGATSHTAGGFRNLYTTDINMKISNKGIELLGRFKEDMGMTIGFQQNGYLFTYYEANWKQIPRVAAILEANKVNFQLLTPGQVEAKIPGLRSGVDHIDPEVREALGMEPIAGGLFGADCGSFDPSQATVGYFERAATDFKVKPVLQLNTQAVEVTFDQAGRANGVRLKTAGAEELVEAGLVALCTGPWTNPLLRASRFPAEDLMPIIAQKRMLFMADFPDDDPRWQDIPLTCIDQGIYFKFESGSLMIGKARIDAPDSLDTTFEPEYYINEINLIMQERMPVTAKCKLKSGWAHLYDTNIADHNAILGWHENHPGLLLQVGYSGHGAMQGPAVGLCLAELVVHGKYRTIDCTPFRWGRFQENDLVTEAFLL
jgi:glycine/D-amino acid oxidase-like deaminating enzyme